MANLLYICPDPALTSKSLCIELATTMISCSHSTRVLSTYSPENEDFEPPQKLEFLMPFKKWSLFEFPKIVMSTQGFPPDVVHLFLNSDLPKAQQWVLLSLPSYFKSIHGSKLVLHIEGKIPLRSMVFSQWMHQADLVITKDHYQLLKASSLFESPPSQLLMTLNSEQTDSHDDAQLQWLSNWFQRFFYAAGSIRTVDEAIAIIKSCEYLLKSPDRTGLVLNIENMRGGIASEAILQAFIQDNFFEPHVCLLHSVSAEQNAELVQNCSHYIVAHLGVEPSQMTLALDSVLRPEQIAICSSQQAFFIKSSARKRIKIQECVLGKPLISEVNEVYQTEGLQYDQELPSADLGNLLNRAYQQILS